MLLERRRVRARLYAPRVGDRFVRCARFSSCALWQITVLRLDQRCMIFSRSRPSSGNIAPLTIKVALINIGTPTMGVYNSSEVSNSRR